MILCLDDGEMVEVSRTKHDAPKWCFKCRSREEFFEAVLHPAPGNRSMMAYPRLVTVCGNCNTEDSDLFPGNYREERDPYWEEYMKMEEDLGRN